MAWDMSDSDSELANNLFNFQNESTMVSFKGPNRPWTNITIPKVQNNVSSLSMQIPENFERQRYAESNYDQRSMYRRREASPMSVTSACDMRQRNFNNSCCSRGADSQRSGLYGRSGSVMGARSIVSSASVIPAADIAMFFKNGIYSENDFRVIKDAYNRYKKRKYHRKIKKRVNLKQFLKGGRHRSGGDSGEQGSDSSSSSDDRSTRTSNYKENRSSCRSTKTDILEFRKKIKESDLYKDCTDNFRHNTTCSVTSNGTNFNRTHTSLSSHRSMITMSKMPSCRSVPMPPNFNSVQKKVIIPAMSQKERFTTGFLLPSQRFNRSVASATIQENPHDINSSNRNNLQNGINTETNVIRTSATNIETDSDFDDIFSEATSKINKNANVQRKRSIDTDDMNLPNQKRAKVANPCNDHLEKKKSASNGTNLNSHDNGVTHDFVFAKPTFPVTKSIKKKRISKSDEPKSDNFVQPLINPSAFIEQAHPEKPVEPEKKDNEDEPSNATQNTTDLSMRPSFIKRKLFTQRLDISEKRNTSADNLNSPQNSIYGAIQKEKNKARKLQQVTTQSCLSRDVQQDENNLLDLINKVVPIEQMNVTNQANKTYFRNGTNKSKENEDKWDVTSLISTRNNDEDESETYTDEEIFNATVKELAKKDNSKQSSPLTKKNQAANKHDSKHSPIKGKKKLVKDLLKKPSPVKRNENILKENVFKKNPVIILQRHKICGDVNVIANKSKQKCLKSFWEADFESDVECQLLQKENREKSIKMPVISSQEHKINGDVNVISNKSAQKCLKSVWDTDFESDLECQPFHREHTMNLKENQEKELLHPKDTTKFQEFSRKFNLNTHAAASNTHTSTILNNTVDRVQKFNSTSLRIRSHRTPKRKKVDQTKNIDATFDVLEPESNKQKTFQANSFKEPTKTKKVVQNIEFKDIVPKQANTKTNKQTNTNRKPYEIKSQFKTQNPETKNPKKETVKNNSRYEATLIGENNNSNRPVRSGRNSKKNDTPHKLNLALSGKLNKEIETPKDKVTKQLSKRENAKAVIQTSTSKKTAAETKSQNKKSSPKARNNKKNGRKNNISVFKDTSIEENNNNCSYSHRPVRSCRNSTKNKTSDKSILSRNGTPNRNLRSRQIYSTSTSNDNITKGKQKVSNNTKVAKSRQSDTSFSLVSENNTVAKRAVKKTTNSHLFKAKDFETSDVSFSLTPTPKKAKSRSQVNAKAGKRQDVITKSTPCYNAAIDKKRILISKNECISKRVRTPSKRYLMP